MWGRDPFTQVAVNDENLSSVRQPMRSLTLSAPQQTDPVIHFAADNQFALAITRGGKTFVWGNRAATLTYGLPLPDSQSTPQQMPVFSPGANAGAPVQTLSGLNGDSVSYGPSQGRVFGLLIGNVSAVPIFYATAVSGPSLVDIAATPRELRFSVYKWSPYIVSTDNDVYEWPGAGENTTPRGRAFVKIRSGTSKLLPYAPFHFSGDIDSNGMMFLETNSKLFYTSSPPWATVPPFVSDPVEIPMSNIFPSSIQSSVVITNMYGRFSWFWFRDQNLDLWSIGRNPDMQQCHLNTGNISTAIKLQIGGLSNKDVIKVITTLADNNPVARGASIIVTNTSIVICVRLILHPRALIRF